MKASKSLLVVALCAFMATGCSTHVGDFTVASTKNIDVRTGVHRIDDSVRVRDRDVAHIVIFFPTGLPNMKEAMDNAIEQKPGAVGLSNVTVKRGGFYIPFIYGQDYFEIEGNPIYEVR